MSIQDYRSYSKLKMIIKFLICGCLMASGVAGTYFSNDGGFLALLGIMIAAVLAVIFFASQE